jgi:hypothetical protein
VNTGVFVLGCYVFFADALQGWADAANVASLTGFIFFVLVGLNFVVEFAVNVILSGGIARILKFLKSKNVLA